MSQGLLSHKEQKHTHATPRKGRGGDEVVSKRFPWFGTKIGTEEPPGVQAVPGAPFILCFLRAMWPLVVGSLTLSLSSIQRSWLTGVHPLFTWDCFR